jgi:8-oxo-dGTP pyrophosphatase MutT (NUDIX family)
VPAGPAPPAWLDRYEAKGEAERQDVERVRRLRSARSDPYDRALPLHLTGSAVVVDRPARRVLLRWHERQRAWLQVGGHGDPGEVDPFDIALREAAEETALDDLAPWQPVEPVHVVIVPVTPKGDEPAHEHADVRYVLTTSAPERAHPENDRALLRWVDLDEAIGEVEPNLAETLRRVRRLLS